jgi:hypothetical protein
MTIVIHRLINVYVASLMTSSTSAFIIKTVTTVGTQNRSLSQVLTTWSPLTQKNVYSCAESKVLCKAMGRLKERRLQLELM